MSTCSECAHYVDSDPAGRKGACGTDLPRYTEPAHDLINTHVVLPSSKACSAFRPSAPEVHPEAPADVPMGPHLQLLAISGAIRSLPEGDREKIQIACARLRATMLEFGMLGQLAFALLGAEMAADVDMAGRKSTDRVVAGGHVGDSAPGGLAPVIPLHAHPRVSDMGEEPQE